MKAERFREYKWVIGYSQFIAKKDVKKSYSQYIKQDYVPLKKTNFILFAKRNKGYTWKEAAAKVIPKEYFSEAIRSLDAGIPYYVTKKKLRSIAV